MEFRIRLIGGPCVFAVLAVIFSLDTGEEVSDMALHSFENEHMARTYATKLASMTGLDFEDHTANKVYSFQQCEEPKL